MEIEFNERLQFLFKPARLKIAYGGSGAGIYCILNLIDGKVYIGSAVNLRTRWRQHKSELTLNKHSNIYLQNAFNKYGAFAFEFIILEITETKNELIEREQYWIDITNCCNSECGYNVRKLADSSLGIKRSDITKLKISKANTGIKRSIEFKNKLAWVVTGRKHSETAIANMIKAQKGNDKRKLDKWPHALGIKCKCDECKENRRVYMTKWRASKL